MADKQSTRIAYGEALKKLGAVKKDVLVCDADLAHATMTAGLPIPIPIASTTLVLPRLI